MVNPSRGPTQLIFLVPINYNGVENTKKQLQTPHLPIVNKFSKRNIPVENYIMQKPLYLSIQYIGKASFKIVSPHHKPSQNQTYRPLNT